MSKFLPISAVETAHRWQEKQTLPDHGFHKLSHWKEISHDRVLMTADGVAVVSSMVDNKLELVLQAYLPSAKKSRWCSLAAVKVAFTDNQASQKYVQLMSEAAEKIVELRKQGWLLYAGDENYMSSFCVAEGNGKILWKVGSARFHYNSRRTKRLCNKIIGFHGTPNKALVAGTYDQHVASLRYLAQTTPQAIQNLLENNSDVEKMTEALSRAESIIANNPHITNLEQVVSNLTRELNAANRS